MENTPAPQPDTNTPPENVQPRPVRRVMDVVLPKLRLAFQRASSANNDQPISWDAYLMAAPNPMQPQNIMTGLAIFISIPSPVVGQNLSMTPVIDASFSELGQDDVDAWVRDRINEVLAARSQAMMQRAAAEAAEQNGHREPQGDLGGLIMPPGFPR